MHRFIEGADRSPASLLPASLEDYVDADNPVRVIEAFVDALDLDGLGFAVIPRRPAGRAIIRRCC
jgi:transposase